MLDGIVKRNSEQQGIRHKAEQYTSNKHLKARLLFSRADLPEFDQKHIGIWKWAPTGWYSS